MSDSIVFSITTSPPPVQVVKPAQTVNTPETSFQDVLRAQTESSRPREKIVPERTTAAADRPTEAAKTNKPAEKEVSKGEEYSEEIKSEKPVDEEQTADKNASATTHEGMQTAPVLVAVVTPTPVVDVTLSTPTQIAPETVDLAQPTVQTVNIVPTTDPTLQQASMQQVQVSTGEPTFQEAVASAIAQNSEPAEETENQASATRVLPAATQSVSEQSEIVSEMSEVEPDVAAEKAAVSVETKNQKPVATVKPEETEHTLKSDASTIPVKAEGSDKPHQEQPISTSKPGQVETAGVSEELKVALENGKVEGQVEKAAPKQVQAPPGQQQLDGIAATGKTTFTPQTTQIIEPARLAEAQTIDMIGQITRQLDALNSSGRTTFRLQLSPQDLGQIDLKITSTSHGVGVTILAENGATSKLLETQVAQLRQSLLDAGVQISNLHVGTQGSQSNQSQAQSNYPNHHHQVYSNPSEQVTISETVVPRVGSTLVDYKI